MTRLPLPPARAVAALAACAAATPAWDAAPWLVRLAAVAIWLALAVSIGRAQGRVGPVGPSFLMAGAVLWFYSALPAAALAGLEAYSRAWHATAPEGTPLPYLLHHYAYLPRMAGGVGEQLVVVYALLLTAGAALARDRAGIAGPAAPLPAPAARWLVRGTALVAGLTYATRHFPTIAPRLAFPDKLYDAVVPLVTVCAGYAAVWLYRRVPGAWKDVAFVALPVMLCLPPSAFKVALLFLVGALPVRGMLQRQGRRLVVAGLVGVAVVAAAAFHQASARDQQKERGVAALLVDKVFYKLIKRQADSVLCLNNALTWPPDAPRPFAEDGPELFAAAVMPQALWPNKPNLSRGSAYFLSYCGYDDRLGVDNSFSVTTLGEAFIYAGPVGLAVAMAVLAAVLTLASLAVARAATPMAAVVLALSPWLLDFDLHLSLGLALVVRALLLMAPLVLAVEFLARRRLRG